MIQLAGVDKSVRLPTGDTLQILHSVDLQIGQGEHVAIVGRSGSGKSTLLNVLGLLDNPSAGEYLLDGQHVARLSGKQRSDLRGRTFGFVFQQFNLLPRRSAVENAAVPLLYSSGETFWRRRALARHMLEMVGLQDRLDAKPEQLSGGEQQRVAIARALVRQPKIILADEPTGSLDVDTGVVVMDMLERVCAERGATLITITHDLGVAARANRLFRLEHGSIVHEGDAPTAAVGAAEVDGWHDRNDTRPIEIQHGPADTLFLPPLPGQDTEQIPKPFPHHKTPPAEPTPRTEGQIIPAVVVPSSEPEPARPAPKAALRKSRGGAPWVPQPAEPRPEPAVESPAPEPAQAGRPTRPLRRRRILPARVKHEREEPTQPTQDRPPLDEELYRMGRDQE